MRNFLVILYLTGIGILGSGSSCGAISEADYLPATLPISNSARKECVDVLSEVKEPSLLKRTMKETVVRFIWLRSLNDPIIVRVEFGHGTTAKMYCGVINASNTSRSESKVILLNENESAKLLNQFRQSEIWKMRSKSVPLGAIDGSTWVIEGIYQRKYFAVHEWSPRHGPVRKFGTILIKAAHLTPLDIY